MDNTESCPSYLTMRGANQSRSGKVGVQCYSTTTYVQYLHKYVASYHHHELLVSSGMIVMCDKHKDLRALPCSLA